jgi:hypothetical protein
VGKGWGTTCGPGPLASLLLRLRLCGRRGSIGNQWLRVRGIQCTPQELQRNRRADVYVVGNGLEPRNQVLVVGQKGPNREPGYTAKPLNNLAANKVPVFCLSRSGLVSPVGHLVAELLKPQDVIIFSLIFLREASATGSVQTAV